MNKEETRGWIIDELYKRTDIDEISTHCILNSDLTIDDIDEIIQEIKKTGSGANLSKWVQKALLEDMLTYDEIYTYIFYNTFLSDEEIKRVIENVTRWTKELEESKLTYNLTEGY